MSTATEMLAFYIEAERKVLAGQSVRFGDRQLTRADLDQIQKGRREWEGRVNAEAAALAGRSTGPAIADFSGFN